MDYHLQIIIEGIEYRAIAKHLTYGAGLKLNTDIALIQSALPEDASVNDVYEMNARTQHAFIYATIELLEYRTADSDEEWRAQGLSWLDCMGLPEELIAMLHGAALSENPQRGQLQDVADLKKTLASMLGMQ